MAKNQPQGWPLLDECPHLHFKTNVINRDILTKRQHMELLCTPRGYRWEVAFFKREEHRVFCTNKPLEKPQRTYVYKLLSDLWSLVTPEVMTKLQEIMEQEFNLSKEEARSFVCKQMKEMIQMGDTCKRDCKGISGIHPNKNPPYPLFISKELEQSERIRCRCQMNIKVNPCIVKHMADVLAGKLRGLVEFNMSSKKDHRQRRFSEVIFNGLCEISGDTFDPNNPKSKLQKLQVFLADRVATWLARNIVDEDVERARKRKTEDLKIQENARKMAKDYDKKVRERAALARKIQIQKQVAEEREKEARMKEDANGRSKKRPDNKIENKHRERKLALQV
uniref:Stress response protein nst1 n=1 Tax=Lygus hesperus TaxID=30085 RepID=A0A0A9YPP0_LYGHE